MFSKRLGSRTFRRVAASVIIGLLLGGSMASTVMAEPVPTVDRTVTTSVYTDLTPLTVTMYKEICPTYSDVPANVNPDNLDATGGHWRELDTTDYTTKPVTPDNSTAKGCIPAAGWQFEFTSGQGGPLLATYTTAGADGSVTVPLNAAELTVARNSTGLWVLEVTQASAPFGAIRCYNDMLNGDNLEQITSVPNNLVQVYCFAYNVAEPHLTVTKTEDRSTYNALGQVITYTIKLTNDGNVTLNTPLVTNSSVSDLNCGTFPATLAPAGVINCTASHTIASADITSGSVSNTANGTASFNSTPVTGTATVTATAKPTLTITASSGTMVYGGTPPTITPSYSGLTGGATGPATPPTCSTTATSSSPVGSYPSSCSGAADPNYTIVYVNGSVSVTPAALTVTANNQFKTYGSANPTLTDTITGFVNGDTLSVVTGAASLSTTATASSPVGSYPITAALGTLSAANYSFIFVNGTLSVTPASLTITASSDSMTYGGTVPTITPSYSGFVNGDTAASLVTAPTCSTTAASSSPVGSYPSSCSGAVDPNYTIGYVDGSVSVTPASLTITASSDSMTYGGTVPTITPSYSGFVNGDTAASLVTAPTCSTTAASSSPVGSYPSSCSGAVDPNYTIGYVDGSVSVTPASLTITASSDSMTYGGTVPTITPSYSGFVNGDTAASLVTAPTCSTTAASSSPVGSYPSSCSGAVVEQVGAVTRLAAVSPLSEPG